ncbi:hypothetical protein [Diaphorobacter nitroreducens]|uniref:hypothetical protein n=1 Tax=Diaphorobacter nitroreducens TaxID=164759 RepID=UPI0028AC2ADD|nr:hypothetical protein [Diaphorobacter nitroreducens]
MKIKAIAKELKNADVRFISLVSRGSNRIPFRILKADKGESQMIDLSALRPVLKGETIQAPAKKAANLPPFAQILAGSVNRNIGDAPPKATIAPVQPVQSIARANPETPPSVGKPLSQAFNRPKQPASTMPAASRDNPVSCRDLQAAIDAAMSKQRDEAKAAAFNESRSAFSRIAKTQVHHVQGGGSGNAWGLRNLGGKLASAVLNSTTRKGESTLPTNTGFRAVSGASLKG